MAEPNEEIRGQEEGVKRTKHRSPNYPAIGLAEAVKRVGEVHEKYKRAQVPINLAQELWGYRAHGGAGNQAVAALKAYGLLEVDGDGKNRRVRVSEPAYRILLNSPDRVDQLKKAAVAPPIHRELWDRFKDEGLPQELVRHYLLFDREEGTFNVDSVDGFIGDFRASLEYAGLLSSGIVEDGRSAPGRQTG